MINGGTLNPGSTGEPSGTANRVPTGESKSDTTNGINLRATSPVLNLNSIDVDKRVLLSPVGPGYTPVRSIHETRAIQAYYYITDAIYHGYSDNHIVAVAKSLIRPRQINAL